MKPLSVNTLETPALDRAEARAPLGPTAPGATDAPSFDAQLSSMLNGVEKLQLDADDQAAKAAMGGGNLHELSLALEKADVAMRVAMKVRNKVIDAYHEIMRMSM